MSEKSYKKRLIGNHELAADTLMMGYGFDAALSENALKLPLFQTSTFVFKTAEEGKAFFELAYGLREKEESEEIGLIYSRINNPNLEVLEDRLAVWDKAEKALVFSSGMAAISTSLMSYLRPGDILLHSEPVYGGTEYLARNILPEFGVERMDFCAEDGLAGMEAAAEKARATGKRVGVSILKPQLTRQMVWSISQQQEKLQKALQLTVTVHR